MRKKYLILQKLFLQYRLIHSLVMLNDEKLGRRKQLQSAKYLVQNNENDIIAHTIDVQQIDSFIT